MRDPPAVRVLRQARVLAQLLARVAGAAGPPSRSSRSTATSREPDVHVGRAPRSGGRARVGQREASLVGAHRLARAGPGAIRMSARAIEQPSDVGEVPGPLAGSAMPSAYQSAAPSSRSPLVQAASPSSAGGAAAPEVVVLVERARAPPGVRDRCRRGRPCSQRQRRPGTSRSRRAGGGTRPRRRRPSRLARLRRRARATARRPQQLPRRRRPRRPTAARRRSRRRAPAGARPRSSGSASSQRRSVASCRSRRIAGDRQLDRSAARSKSRPASAWSIASARSPCCLVPVARPAVQLGDVARAARPAGAPAARRRTGGGSGTSGAGRRAATRNRLPRSSASSIACPPSWPVTASHSGPVSRSRIEVCSRKSRTVSGLALQDLLDQVVDDVAVVAGEAGDEPGDVVAALHRERGQLQRGDPALGARLQRGDVAGGERQAHRLVEVRRRLVRREPQVGGADLDQLAARPQPGQRQRAGRRGWRSPGGRAAAGGRAGTPSPRGLRALDDVVVVEHEHDVVVDAAARSLSSVVDDGLDRALRAPRAARARAAPTPGPPVERRDHVGPERDRVVVARVERQPRDAARRPRRLASSARSVVLPKPAGAETASASPRPRGRAARSAAAAVPAGRARPAGRTWSRAAAWPSARASRPSGPGRSSAGGPGTGRAAARTRSPSPRTSGPGRSRRRSRTASGRAGTVNASGRWMSTRAPAKSFQVNTATSTADGDDPRAGERDDDPEQDREPARAVDPRGIDERPAGSSGSSRRGSRSRTRRWPRR